MESVTPTVVTVVCSIVFFIVGVVGGFAGGVLVAVASGSWFIRGITTSNPASLHLLQDVIVTTVVKDKDELELKDNIAYGHLR